MVLDFAGVNFIDSQGSAKLAQLWTLARRTEISLRLVRVSARVMDVLRADGVVDQIGEDRFHADIDAAVKAASGAMASDL